MKVKSFLFEMDILVLEQRVKAAKVLLARWGMKKRVNFSLAASWLDAAIVKIRTIFGMEYPEKNTVVTKLATDIENIVHSCNEPEIPMMLITAKISIIAWDMSLRHAALNRGNIAIPVDRLTTTLSVRFLKERLMALTPEYMATFEMTEESREIFCFFLDGILEKFDKFETGQIREFNHGVLGIAYQVAGVLPEEEVFTKKLLPILNLMTSPEFVTKITSEA
jgi:hypothetical protein